jgi:hypothetical protein
MKIECWNLPKDVHVRDLNLGSKEELKMVKLNANLNDVIAGEAEALLRDYKDVFASSYKELTKIPPHIVQHRIELDTTIPPAH